MMSIINRRASRLRADCTDFLALSMLQVGNIGAAFDQIAGGKMQMPTWNYQSSQGNANNIVGPDTMFGSGQAVMGGEGNIFALVSAGINPAITGTGVVMAVAAIPANSLDSVGRGLSINAFGSMANGTGSRCQIYWNTVGAIVGGTALGGGTLIADTTSSTVGGAFSLGASVYKYGNGVLVAGSGLVGTPSNTQIGVHQQSQIGSTLFALVQPTLLTATENAAINIAVVGTTGGSGAGLSNLVLNLVQITASN